MRNLIFIAFMALLAFSAPIQAETNIFGTEPNNHSFTATVGSESAVVGWMWTPVESFSWGFRLSGALTEAADQTAAKWDTTLVGVGIEFPVIGLESLFSGLPVGGKAYVGLSVDIDIENNFQAYVPMEAGVDVKINKNVSFRVAKVVTELNAGNSTPFPDLRFGVKVEW